MCFGRSFVLGGSSQRTNMNEKSASRRRHVLPRLNICHNLSRWVRRRSYKRLSKVPARNEDIRIRIHPAAARRGAQIINPRLRMVPGVHIRIVSPVSVLLRLRDVYSRKVSLIVTTTAKSSCPKTTVKKQHRQQHVVAAEVNSEMREQVVAAEVASETREEVVAAEVSCEMREQLIAAEVAREMRERVVAADVASEMREQAVSTAVPSEMSLVKLPSVRELLAEEGL